MEARGVIGVLLQLLTAASFPAAVALLLLRPGRKAGGLPLDADPSGLPKEGLKAFLQVSAMAIGSRLLLVALAYSAVNAVFAFGLADAKEQLAKLEIGKPFPPLESLFSRWDAPHYLDIATRGYTAERIDIQWLFIVFYPLYPALTALLKPLFGTVFNAATAVSWASLAGACWFIRKLALLDGDSRQARRAVGYLLIFPAAVFLGAPYTESLFLLLSALCLWALRTRRWRLAGIAGFFAALTRNMGLLLAVPFIVELLQYLGVFSEPQKLKTKRFWADLLRRGAWALPIPAGALVYLLINQIVYGDPFMFMKIQADYWQQRAQAPWKTVLTTWQQLFSDGDGSRKLFQWGPQLLGMLAALVSLPLLVRKLRPAWASYLIVYTAVALTPAWLLSFNRYMMGCVPLFLGIAACVRGKRANVVLAAVFAAAMLFLAGGYLMGMHVV